MRSRSRCSASGRSCPPSPVPPAPTDAASPELVASLSRDLGITPQQALTRLAQQDAAHAVAGRLGVEFTSASWFDPATGKLNVAVTDAAGADRVRAAGAVPKIVTRSQGELAGLAGNIGNLAAGVPGVNGWAVDPRTNTVTVTVNRNARTERTEAFVSRLKALGDVIRVVDTTSAQHQQSGVVTNGDPWWPGTETNCSIGFAAADSSGGQHFLTAGHCTNDVNQAAYGKNSSGSKGEQLGTSNTGGSRSVNGNEGDMGVVAVNQNGWTLSNAVNTWGAAPVSVNGSADAVVGDAICHSGNTTHLRCGTVTEVNKSIQYVDANGNPTVRVDGLTQTNACSNAGDSGGAYYMGSGSTAKAVGLHSGGGNPCGQSDPDTTFQPLNEALQKWNLTLYTGGAQPTSSPTVKPTASPTVSPTVRPTASPTASPTGAPGATVTVTNPGNQWSFAGWQAFAVQIRATDSKGLPLTYTATGLPAGLAISSSGQITGTPTSVGTSTVKVTATDSGGASGSTTFSWQVTGW
ncbi:putative Ig domain-containing protein [Longispora fulva]|uniref:Streptogrisin C n=1 Tax=Longispora fulva TaxID=619741 RepID=A0A8J7KFR8_9ACTN|nr:putative Ig domain-containing protein [Longispora fulva]MBG6134074.1 streptogrisin C [Longispora fulva]